MKILLTATVQSHICQFHRPLVEVLHNCGHEVHVAARDNLAEKNGLTLDFADRVFNVPFSRSPKGKENIEAYKQIKNIIDTEQYDIIHCNTPMGGIVTRLAARKARKNGAKVIYTAHGFHFYKGAPKKNWIVFYPVEKFFSRLTDVLITIVDEDYQAVVNNFHCKVDRIHGVGVDEERYSPVSAEEKQKLRSELGYTAEQKLILCVGELLPNKNQKMAIRAMQKVVEIFPDSRLLIAGNGPEQGRLEAEIEACGLQDNVQLLGYCTCLEKYQRISDLLVACSRREGLGLNVIEAMLTGNPVVASVNRGHKELVRDGKTGYLVNDSEEMANKIAEILNDSQKKTEMGEAGRVAAREYGVTNVKREVEAIYAKL